MLMLLYYLYTIYCRIKLYIFRRRAMLRRFKKHLVLILTVVLSAIVLVACSGTSDNKSANEKKESGENLPEINMIWGKNMHTGIPYLVINNPEYFKEKGIYMNTVSEGRYELIQDDKKVCIVNFVGLQSGTSDALMSQGHVDAALGSNISTIISQDKGLKARILSPVQTGGMSVVFPPNSEVKGWDQVKEAIESSEEPFKLGYHPPIAAPKILIEYVLKEQGLKLTDDPADLEADVLMVDLKGNDNFLNAIPGGHCDAWVGTSPTTDLAQEGGTGKIALELEEYPPAGEWKDAPCCVFTATDDAIKNKREELKAIIRMLDEGAKYFTEHRDEASKILAEVIGSEEETVKNSNVRYSTEVSEPWLNSIEVYIEAIEKLGQFDDQYKGKSFKEISEDSFDFSLLEEVKSSDKK